MIFKLVSIAIVFSVVNAGTIFVPTPPALINLTLEQMSQFMADFFNNAGIFLGGKRGTTMIPVNPALNNLDFSNFGTMWAQFINTEEWNQWIQQMNDLLNNGGLFLPILPGKRGLNEEELKGLFSGITNIIKPIVTSVVTSAITDIAIGVIGKRDLNQEELKGLFSGITNIIKPIVTSVVTSAITDIAIGVIGKRGTTMIPVNPALENLTVESIWAPLANLLSGDWLQQWQNFLNNGGLLGKRELTEETIKGWWVDKVRPLLQQAATSALITAVIGKRDLNEEELKGLWSSITNIVKPIVTSVVTSTITDIAISAIGKRDLNGENLKGLLSSISGAVSTVFQQVLSNPPILCFTSPCPGK